MVTGKYPSKMSQNLVSNLVMKVRCFSHPWYHPYLSSAEDPEEEKALQKQLTEEYKPLLEWIKKEAKDVIQDGEFTQFSANN